MLVYQRVEGIFLLHTFAQRRQCESNFKLDTWQALPTANDSWRMKTQKKRSHHNLHGRREVEVEHDIPLWELTYPFTEKALLKMIFIDLSFPKVGYVSSLKGNIHPFGYFTASLTFEWLSPALIHGGCQYHI